MKTSEIKEVLSFAIGTLSFVALGLLLAFAGGMFLSKANTFILAMAH